MTFHKSVLTLLTVAVGLSLSLTGCASPAPEPEETGPFKMLISSEAEFLKPLLEKAIRDKGLEPEIKVGSGTVGLVESLNRTEVSVPDAVAIAGAGWLPDTIGASIVGEPETVAWSPVVVGLKAGTASGVTIPVTELLSIVAANPKGILAARGDGSDASVLFWIGALSAKAGGGTLKEVQMRAPDLNAAFGSLAKGTLQVDETAGSLASQAQSAMGKLKGVITYEATLGEINRQLEAEKKPKLQPTRLKGGTLSGSITLAFVGKSPKRQEVFRSLVAALKDAPNQKVIQEKGWLTTAPRDTLETPATGTLWSARRLFQRSLPELAAQIPASR